MPKEKLIWSFGAALLIPKLLLSVFLSRCNGSLMPNEECFFFFFCGLVVQSVFEEHLRFVNHSCITWCSSGPEAVSLGAATSLDFPPIHSRNWNDWKENCNFPSLNKCQMRVDL